MVAGSNPARGAKLFIKISDLFLAFAARVYDWRVGDSGAERGGLTALSHVAPNLCGRQQLRSRFGRLGNPGATIEVGPLQRALVRLGHFIIEMFARGFVDLIINPHDTQLLLKANNATFTVFYADNRVKHCRPIKSEHSIIGRCFSI
jgi:hypothetical protein